MATDEKAESLNRGLNALARKAAENADAEMVELLGASPEWPRPIPVSERLPDKYKTYSHSECVLVCAFLTRDKILPTIWAVGFYDHTISMWKFGSTTDDVCFPDWTVTHWLPLPPEPE